MSYAKRVTPLKFFLVIVFLTIASAGIAFGQAGWKTAQEKGFTLKYPSDWNYLDLGGDDYEGTQGWTRALSPPNETNFVMIVMLFPKFSIDLKTNKMTYTDFIKSVFDNFLKEGDQKDLTVEPTDALLKHGKVPAFMVMEAKTEESLKASMICGDLLRGNAAIVMLTMNLAADQAEAGKQYLDEAEQIMASFTFPK